MLEGSVGVVLPCLRLQCWSVGCSPQDWSNGMWFAKKPFDYEAKLYPEQRVAPSPNMVFFQSEALGEEIHGRNLEELETWNMKV